MTDSILIETDGAVTIISIDRPERRNAVDGATARKLFDAFLAFDADTSASSLCSPAAADIFAPALI